MSARLRSALFVALCVAQLAVPLSLVARHEQTRAHGLAFRFQTAPVDPGDAFRGRYVQLRYSVERAPVPLADPQTRYIGFDVRAYAEVEAGPDGFARLVRVHATRPQGVTYIDVLTRQMPPGAGVEHNVPTAVFVHLPFDRYYLPEERAPQVERDYAAASRNAQDRTYAEVRVLDGHAALTGLVLDGKPVE